jgi:hypothetical protein
VRRNLSSGSFAEVGNTNSVKGAEVVFSLCNAYVTPWAAFFFAFSVNCDYVAFGSNERQTLKTDVLYCGCRTNDSDRLKDRDDEEGESLCVCLSDWCDRSVRTIHLSHEGQVISDCFSSGLTLTSYSVCSKC